MAILVQSNRKPSVSYPEQTGSIVTFNSQYAGLPLKSHKIALTATQSGSGTPSPDNVRPISGWSAINIGAVGANVWDETTKQGYYHASGGYYVNVSGQLCSNTFIAVQPETTYRFVKPNTHGDVLYYGSDKTYLNQYRAPVPKNGTFTTPSGCYYITINLGNNYGATYNNDVIIAYPSGTYTTIQIGSTVYGGEYDARTGVLTVTHKGILARDVGTWAKSSNVFYKNFPDIWTAVTPDTPTGRKPLLCSHFSYKNSYALADLQIGYGGVNNNGNIIITYHAMSTESDFNDYIANNDVFIVYPLATPQTIQLPPCPIDTLEGVNNIWADTGETTVQYIKIG